MIAVLQLNPAYEPAETLADLATADTIGKETAWREIEAVFAGRNAESCIQSAWTISAATGDQLFAPRSRPPAPASSYPLLTRGSPSQEDRLDHATARSTAHGG